MDFRQTFRQTFVPKSGFTTPFFLKVKTKNHSFCSLEPSCLSSTYNHFPFEPKMGLEPTTCSLRMKLKKAMLSFEFQFLVTLLQKCSDKPFDKPFDKPYAKRMTKIRLILHRHKDRKLFQYVPKYEYAEKPNINKIQYSEHYFSIHSP